MGRELYSVCLKTEPSSVMGSSVLHAATDSEKMEVSVAASAANSNTYCGKTTSDSTVNTACPFNLIY